MGVDTSIAAFLTAARRLGVSYETTLQLGRQDLPGGVNLRAAFRAAGYDLAPEDADLITQQSAGYADGLLRHLGASTVESLDASGWEGSTHVYDLNEPLPAQLRRRYSVVFDGGTLEHVFDFPTALRGALDAVQLGGHFLAVTPTNGWSGHGFYQFSPELYYSYFEHAGFEPRCVLVRAQQWGARFYRVPSPASVRRRVPMRSVWPYLMYVVAERVSVEDLSGINAQQSDYAAAWEEGTTTATSWRRRVKTAAPAPLRKPLSEIYNMAHSLARFPLVSRDFEPVKLRDLARVIQVSGVGARR